MTGCSLRDFELICQRPNFLDYWKQAGSLKASFLAGQLELMFVLYTHTRFSSLYSKAPYFSSAFLFIILELLPLPSLPLLSFGQVCPHYFYDFFSISLFLYSLIFLFPSLNLARDVTSHVMEAWHMSYVTVIWLGKTLWKLLEELGYNFRIGQMCTD